MDTTLLESELPALRQRLMRQARLAVHDSAHAEDLVQDTLIAVVQQAATYRGDAALSTWASLAEIDVVAVGEGRLIPTARVQRIQPVEAGRVIALHVDDGIRVRRDDTLVELEDTLRRADRDRLASDALAGRVELARLREALDREADRLRIDVEIERA